MEKNITHVFLFLIYDVCLTAVCTLIKSSYVCVLKGFTTFS